MSDIIVAVPSHDRAQAANRRTLRLFAERGVPAEQVHVFVAPDEVDAYRAALDPGLYAELHPGGPSLVTQRNTIIDTFPEGARVVSADDDLDDVVRRVGEKETEPVADLMAEFGRGFDACAAAGATLWGIYPVLNPYFMRAGRTTDLRFCIGHLFGTINTHAEWGHLTIQSKDDYERTLLRYEHDGAVVRLNDIAAKTKMGVSGGLASRLEDRRAVNRREVMYLQRRWPQWVTIQKRRSTTSGLEIRVRESARAR